MAKKSKSGTRRKGISPKGEKFPVKWEDLDRARFKQLLGLDARLCGSRRDGWSTQAIADYLHRHGYRGLFIGAIRNALLLSGFRRSKETKYWEIGEPLLLPPSPRVLEYRLRELSPPPPVQPSLLVPSYNRFQFLQVLNRTGDWMHRSEVAAKAAPGMQKNSANSVLNVLVGSGYVEARPDQTTMSDVRYPPNQYRILPHGRRTVALLRSFVEQIRHRTLPSAEDAEILQLLREFPNGLYGYQIVSVMRERRPRQIAFFLLHHALRNGYIEATTLADNVDFNLWGHNRRFYRTTPAGDRWVETLENLAASRCPERERSKASARSKPLVDDGDIPVTNPFSEEMTRRELARAVGQRRALLAG